MLKKLFQKFFPQPKMLEAIQVEISSICNLKCRFCPLTEIPCSDKEKFMNLESFSKLQPYFKTANHVHLQGWGEPLLAPDVWEMIRLIKGEGVKAGFTTNGTLFSQKNIKNIMSSGVDYIAISIAGSTPQTHDNLRKGSSLKKILNDVAKIIALKEHEKLKIPRLSFSYMMTSESIHELPAAVKLGYELGIDDVYTTNVDYIFNRETDKLRIFKWEEEPPKEYQDLISEAVEFAKSKNFSFRPYPLSAREELPVCELDPRKFVFISSDGQVSPCAYLSRTINPRYYKGKLFKYPQLAFGNITTEDFMEIWNKKTYRDFRGIFAKRVKNEFDIEALLLAVTTSEKVVEEKEKQGEEEVIPLPEVCCTCPKAYGV